MRVPTVAILAFLAPVFAASVAAQEIPAVPDRPFAGPPPVVGGEVEISRDEKLDQLFATLAATDDPRLAQSTEGQISAIWMESGSDTIDLLMKWAVQAIEDEDLPLALDFLDRVVSLDPRFAEGWNKRASVFFMSDEYGKALADIEHVLAIEPRHFRALSGLGTIMRSVGEKERAVEAYRRALELAPHLDSIRDALDQVEAEIIGQQA